MSAPTFRLKPRHRGLALASCAGALCLLSVFFWHWSRGQTYIPLLVGALCAFLLGGLYLLSPVWRWTVVVTPEALVVATPKQVKTRIPWQSVHRASLAKDGTTLYLRGEDASTSFVAPGPGLSAPYRIERQAQLVTMILDRLDPACVTHVDRPWHEVMVEELP